MIEEQMQELVDNMAIQEIPLDEGWRLLHATVLIEAATEVGPDVSTESKKTEMVRDIKAHLYGPVRSELRSVRRSIRQGNINNALEILSRVMKELK
jgi:hypothetical protein